MGHRDSSFSATQLRSSHLCCRMDHARASVRRTMASFKSACGKFQHIGTRDSIFIMWVQFSPYGVLFSSHGVRILTLWGPILISCVHPQPAKVTLKGSYEHPLVLPQLMQR